MQHLLNVPLYTMSMFFEVSYMYKQLLNTTSHTYFVLLDITILKSVKYFSGVYQL